MYLFEFEIWILYRSNEFQPIRMIDARSPNCAFERYYSFGFYLRSIRKETSNERILLYKRKFYKSVIRLLYF